jgi:hypothetical protein
VNKRVGGIVLGSIIGLVLGTAAVVVADVTAPHFAANDDESIQRCFNGVTENTKVSFTLTPDGIDYDDAVCWPDGIR